MLLFSNRPRPLTPATGHTRPPISTATSLEFGSLLLADRQSSRRARAAQLLAVIWPAGRRKPRAERAWLKSTGKDAFPPWEAHLLRRHGGPQEARVGLALGRACP